jgi:hypothetical protein
MMQRGLLCGDCSLPSTHVSHPSVERLAPLPRLPLNTLGALDGCRGPCLGNLCRLAPTVLRSRSYFLKGFVCAARQDTHQDVATRRCVINQSRQPQRCCDCSCACTLTSVQSAAQGVFEGPEANLLCRRTSPLLAPLSSRHRSRAQELMEPPLHSTATAFIEHTAVSPLRFFAVGLGCADCFALCRLRRGQCLQPCGGRLLCRLLRPCIPSQQIDGDLRLACRKQDQAFICKI